MRLASILPAFIVVLAVQGPAQDPGSLPPTIQPGQSIMSAPAAGGPASNSVMSVNTTGQVTSSTSSSKQFTVYGADLQTRGAFCQLCEDIASDLGRLLRDDGKFALPIVVVLKTPPNINPTEPVITYNFSQLAYGGFHLQINAELRNDFNAEDFSRELVRMLLAERILRNHKEVQTTRSQLLSGWLLTGVTQAMEFRGRSRPSALFAAVFRSGQVYSIDRIIEANPKELDSLARGIYEVSSCALVLALLDQQDGAVRFSRFLSALANGKKGDRELLKEHFPTLGASKNSLEKWWTLQMAALATPSTFESMSFVQTEEALAEALTFRIPQGGSEGSGTAASRTSSKPGAPEASATTEQEKEPEKKKGWFRFGRKDKDKEEAPKEEAKPEVKKDEPKSAATPAAVPAPTPAPAAEEPEKKPPSRAPTGFFSGGRKIAAPIKAKPEDIDGQAPAKPVEAAKPATSEKKAPAPKPAAPAANAAAAPAVAPVAVEEKKPRGFRGLFGRKKEAEATPAPVPAPAPAVETKKPAPAPVRKPQTKKPVEASKENDKKSTKEADQPPAKDGKAPEKADEARPDAEKMQPKEESPAPGSNAEQVKAEADKPDTAATGSKKEEPKKDDAAAADKMAAEMGPPAPNAVPPVPATAPEKPKDPEGKVEITMPADAEIRRPGEALPPGVPQSPVPGSEFINPPASPGMPGLPAANGGPQSPLPFLPEPTPPPPTQPETETPLPLIGKVMDPDLTPLEDFAKLTKRKDRIDILKRTLNQINSVKLRAHPLYRPLIGDYATVVQNMILGREKGLSEELARLRATHNEIRIKARAVESYVDWYEASQTQTYSHVFDDYLKLRDDLDKDVIPRTDSLSRYLDALEKEFEE